MDDPPPALLRGQQSCHKMKTGMSHILPACLPVLGLCCCSQAFSSCGERGLLFVEVCGLLIAVASHCGARALGARVSVVVARGL